MKLSLKQKALLHTVGFFAIASLTAFAVTFILANVSLQIILTVLGVGFFAFCAWVFYGITLSQLEYKENLKEIIKKD